MPAPNKRTRQTAEDENAHSGAPIAPPTPSSSRPTTRRAVQHTSATPDDRIRRDSHDSTASTSTSATSNGSRASTPSSRPILTRSATLLTPVSSPLTRSSSTFGRSRGGNNASSGSGSSSAGGSGFAGAATGSGAYGGFGLGTPSSESHMAGPTTRSGGVLLRTQSTPTLASPASLKQALALGGGGAGRGKGDPEDVFGSGSGGPKGFGRGKENIPPKKDGEEDGQRGKRLRVTSTGRNVSGRGRSGSVASVRSETSSSAASLLSRHASLLSPSPSPSLASSRSSIDPFELLNDETDVERTPTKARPTPGARSARGFLPTPPPSSSPIPRSKSEVDATRKRIALFRMGSSSSLNTIDTASEEESGGGGGSDTETETEAEPSSPLKPKCKARSAYRQLKSLLRLSSTDKATPDQIIGRQDEKDALKSYFSMRSDVDVGMYVSGPPGTGKTALVTSMGREVAKQGWKVVEVGCMGLKVADVWRRLGEGLGCTMSEEGVCSFMARQGKDTLIILDEIDSLLPAPPASPTSATSHLLSKLFAFPLLSDSRQTVKLIAISNTLDLTVRAKLVLPHGAHPTVLPFKAYGASDMASIITSRLDAAVASSSAPPEAMVKVDVKAVELLTRKVEAQNGDLRMSLASLASAVNLAESEWIKKSLTAQIDPLSGTAGGASSLPLIKVSLAHVIKAFSSQTQQLKGAAGSAISSGTTSPTTRKIRSVPLQGKMVLVSILVYFSRVRAGMPGIPICNTMSSSGSTSPSNGGTPNKHGDLTTSTLYATYSAILSHESSPFPPAAESDYRDILSNLETLGLVSLHGGQGNMGGGIFGAGVSMSMSRVGSGTGSRSKAGANAGVGGPRVELCVREEEVRAGLGLEMLGAPDGFNTAQAHSQQKGSADEEVGKVWMREEVKVERQRMKLAKAAEALRVVAAEEGQ